MPVPVVVQMPVAVAVEAVIGTTTTGSATSYRMFAARWETVLGDRQRSTSDEQRSDNRDIFPHSHHQNAHATHPDEQMKVPRKACCFDLDQYPAQKGERAKKRFGRRWNDSTRAVGSGGTSITS
jgi:hypothetical protein